MKDVGCMGTRRWYSSRDAGNFRLHLEGRRLTNHTLTDDGCKEPLLLQVQLRLQALLLQQLLLHRLHFLSLMAMVIAPAPVCSSRCRCLKSQGILLLRVVMRSACHHLPLCCTVLVSYTAPHLPKSDALAFAAHPPAPVHVCAPGLSEQARTESE